MCDIESAHSDGSVIRVGSRKSELALIQTKFVISKLKDLYPKNEFEIVTMCTLGDKVLDIPLPKIGEKSLFTKELEICLHDGSIDFVVHSLKDLPTVLPEGMAIGAILKREDPRDALVIRKGLVATDIDSLEAGSVIGTSSLRRTAQLSKKYPHVKVENIRGNLNTRLKKLDEQDNYSAIMLARSGLNRMGWQDRISQVFDYDEIMYAVGQGALAVECRQSDSKILGLLKPLNDLETVLQIIAERSFLTTLGGGCSAPVAVACYLKHHKNGFKIDLKGAVWSLDGKTELTDEHKFEIQLDRRSKRFKTSRSDGASEIEDCVNRCDSCPYQKRNQGSRKRGSAAAASSTKDVGFQSGTSKCPAIDIEIGVDFMGKCPYLELISQNALLDDANHFQFYENSSKINCPFIIELIVRQQKQKNLKKDEMMNTTSTLTSTLTSTTTTMTTSTSTTPTKCTTPTACSASSDATQADSSPCPRPGLTQPTKPCKNKLSGLSKAATSPPTPHSPKLYCGLVLHEDKHFDAFEDAERIGILVANKLLDKGAQEIMDAAKSIVHSKS